MDHQVAEPPAHTFRVHRPIPLINGLWREEQIGPEGEAPVVPCLDDHDLDQDLKRPDIELLDALLQDVIVLLRRPDQQRIRQLVRDDRDGPGERRGFRSRRGRRGTRSGRRGAGRWHHIAPQLVGERRRGGAGATRKLASCPEQ